MDNTTTIEPNTAKDVVRRDARGRLLPGSCLSHNGGRPKTEWGKIIAEIGQQTRIKIMYLTPLSELKYMEIDTREKTTDPKLPLKYAVIAVLYKRALAGDVAAIKEIFDRTEGKAVQKIINSTEENEENLSILTNEELEQYLKLKAKTEGIQLDTSNNADSD